MIVMIIDFAIDNVMHNECMCCVISVVNTGLPAAGPCMHTITINFHWDVYLYLFVVIPSHWFG